MSIETSSDENSRLLNPRNEGEVWVLVGDISALFAALIESSIGARHVPADVPSSTEFHSDDVLVFIGENPPINGALSVQSATANPHGPEIIVVRSTPSETADAAAQHYLIRPGSDLALLYGLANILIASGWIDRDSIGANTSSFEEFAQFVTHFTTDIVSEATGINADDLWHFAQTISAGMRVSFWWQMHF